MVVVVVLMVEVWDLCGDSDGSGQRRRVLIVIVNDEAVCSDNNDGE